MRALFAWLHSEVDRPGLHGYVAAGVILVASMALLVGALYVPVLLGVRSWAAGALMLALVVFFSAIVVQAVVDVIRRRT